MLCCSEMKVLHYYILSKAFLQLHYCFKRLFPFSPLACSYSDIVYDTFAKRLALQPKCRAKKSIFERLEDVPSLFKQYSSWTKKWGDFTFQLLTKRAVSCLANRPPSNCTDPFLHLNALWRITNLESFETRTLCCTFRAQEDWGKFQDTTPLTHPSLTFFHCRFTHTSFSLVPFLFRTPFILKHSGTTQITQQHHVVTSR